MSTKEKYKRLKAVLSETLTWPNVYVFKFILPDDPLKLSRLHSLFSENSEVTYKKSKTGKYLSVTCKEVMLNPDAVIERYQLAENIEEVIIL